jgi:hypothetical protein
MVILHFNRYVLSICAAAAMLTGCGALPLSLSKGQDDTQPLPGPALIREPSLPPKVQPDLGPSWIAPKAKQVDLLYVASQMTTNVDVYSYPQGKKAGTLTGLNFPNGLCSDRAREAIAARLSDVDVMSGEGNGADVSDIATFVEFTGSYGGPHNQFFYDLYSRIRPHLLQRAAEVSKIVDEYTSGAYDKLDAAASCAELMGAGFLRTFFTVRSGAWEKALQVRPR